MTHGSRGGIDLFIEDGAYTTVASAVTILLVLALVFSSATAAWTLTRSGDVQASADATALAGANVVSSYHTAATVLDASILSMGLAGFCVTGVGLVGLLIPGAHAIAADTVDVGLRILEYRNKFASSASKGLSTVEKALPLLVAANGTRTCLAQGRGETSYTGTALPVPLASASEFPALEGDAVPTDSLETAADGLDAAAAELEEASEESARAKEAAWLVDCGRSGRNMQERAGSLAALSAAQNSDYASSITWDPSVGIERTRAYYRQRLAANAPEGGGAEAAADAAARTAFYEYALKQFQSASFTEAGGRVSCSVPLLPRNTQEVRSTELYTDPVWPSTREDGGLTLHYGSSCPGATGPTGPALALSAIDSGSAVECPVCRFSVGDVGKTPAASTSIDNGYEYHLREFTLALQDYAACRNRELELEEKARGAAEGASQEFEDALATLAGKRPRIAPPGRYGCLAVVVTGAVSSPADLISDFAPGSELPARGALSAAVLAPDEASADNNILSEFFSSLEERAGGGGAAGLVSDVMGLWGSILVAYGDLGESLGSVMDDLLSGLGSLGLGSVATWLGDQIDAAVRGLGFEPVDLSPLKPVLTDSASVIAHADVPALADVQDLLRSLPVGSTDSADMLEALQYEVGERISSTTFTIAEIPLPGGGSIPLTIRLGDLASLVGGAP